MSCPTLPLLFFFLAPGGIVSIFLSSLKLERKMQWNGNLKEECTKRSSHNMKLLIERDWARRMERASCAMLLVKFSVYRCDWTSSCCCLLPESFNKNFLEMHIIPLVFSSKGVEWKCWICDAVLLNLYRILLNVKQPDLPNRVDWSGFKQRI